MVVYVICIRSLVYVTVLVIVSKCLRASNTGTVRCQCLCHLLVRTIIAITHDQVRDTPEGCR